jgi:hypothetical protein
VVEPEHEFAFDAVLGGAEAFAVFDVGDAGGIVVDEVGDVGERPLQKVAGCVVLPGNQGEDDLFAQICNSATRGERAELDGAAGLFAGLVGAVGIVAELASGTTSALAAARSSFLELPWLEVRNCVSRLAAEGAQDAMAWRERRSFDRSGLTTFESEDHGIPQSVHLR